MDLSAPRPISLTTFLIHLSNRIMQIHPYISNLLLRITFVTILATFGATLQTAAQTPSAKSDSTLFIIPSPSDAIAPEGRLEKEPTLGHFSWGADLGSSVDLTGNDMTSIDIHGCFGYKGPWIRLAGIGAGINSMMNNASRCYPVYAIVRTSFTREPKLCFLDLRLGISFNNILDYKSQTDFCGTIGAGITLAKGKKFSSHIIVSYNFMPIRPFKVYRETDSTGRPSEDFEGSAPQKEITVTHVQFPDLHFAAIRIGCSF